MTAFSQVPETVLSDIRSQQVLKEGRRETLGGSWGATCFAGCSISKVQSRTARFSRFDSLSILESPAFPVFPVFPV